MEIENWSVPSLNVVNQFATSKTRMPRVREEERGRVLGMFEAGVQQVRIAAYCSLVVPKQQFGIYSIVTERQEA
jgi:hypothetical protein